MKIIYKDGHVGECPQEEELHVIRHTAAHVMAQAIKRLYPQADFAFGPATQNGFYYDVDLGDQKLGPEDLEAIEKEMKKIVKENLPIKAFVLNREDSKKLMAERGENYKLEHMDDLADESEFSFFQQGEYVDMCLGPHLTYTKALKAFKVTQQSGAYWKDDSSNKMLTRINGVAFRTQQELDEYLVKLEEAKKRDHRKLGRELGLFAFRDEAPGFPFYLPKGMVLRNTLIDYWREVHKKWDYVEISTPQIMRRTLWETSGHWDHYKDNMYTTVIDGEDFAIKPMNCPGSILVYDLEPHSYRDLPLRYGELGLVHRHELSGALHGMFRVRCFTQDDAHILLAPEQIKDEVIRIARLFDEVYSLFGLPYTIELSTMPEDHIGSVEDWDVATAALADAITSIGKEYIINPGDGAFYGPKLDFHIQDSLGRTWQCGTIQLDYQLPGRFDLASSASSPSISPAPSRPGSAPCRPRSCPSPTAAPSGRRKSSQSSSRAACAPRSTCATRRSATRSARRRCRRSPTCSSSATRRPRAAPSPSVPARARTSARCRWTSSSRRSAKRSASASAEISTHIFRRSSQTFL